MCRDFVEMLGFETFSVAESAFLENSLVLTQVKMSSKQYLKARYSFSFHNFYKSDTKQDVIKTDILIHDNSYVLIS